VQWLRSVSAISRPNRRRRRPEEHPHSRSFPSISRRRSWNHTAGSIQSPNRTFVSAIIPSRRPSGFPKSEGTHGYLARRRRLENPGGILPGSLRILGEAHEISRTLQACVGETCVGESEVSRTSSLELKRAREFLNKARETVTRIGGKNFLAWDIKVRSSGRVLQLSGIGNSLRNSRESSGISRRGSEIFR